MNNKKNSLQMILFEQEKQEFLGQTQKPQAKKTNTTIISGLTSLGGESIHLHPRANHFIDLDGGYIGYELNFTRRRSLGIYVSAQGVSVNVPKRALLREVENFIQEKAKWIFKKLKDQKDRQYKLEACRIQWCSGAMLTYLGKPMQLFMNEHEPTIQLHEQEEQYTLSLGGVKPDASESVLREKVQYWMQQQALECFKKRSAYYAPILNVAPVSIKLTNATTRWGSAASDGAIRLHWRLLEMPLELLDYVVVHELAHLLEMNHSERYWSIVEQVLPDYKKRRLQLKNKILPIW